ADCRTRHVPARSRGTRLKPASRFARRERSAVVAALLSVLLASCSSTSEPALDLVAPAYNDAGSPELNIAEAGNTIAQSDAALPGQMAAATTESPAGKKTAPAEAATTA